MIEQFICLILTLNNLILNGMYYLKRKEYTIGTACVPSYSNILLGKLESKYRYLFIEDLLILYIHYIDVFFLKWKATKEQLVRFGEILNKGIQQENLKFNVNTIK